MPDTPLNPDAIAHAKDAGVDCRINGGSTEDVAECAVEAYLAVAQPVVNSMEELKALPAGSAITTFADGRCTIVAMKVSDNQWASTGQQRVWTTADVHAGLKGQSAAVLHRPESS